MVQLREEDLMVQRTLGKNKKEAYFRYMLQLQDRKPLWPYVSKQGFESEGQLRVPWEI